MKTALSLSEAARQREARKNNRPPVDEGQVLALYAEGLNCRQVADRLKIGVSTAYVIIRRRHGYLR